jgi:transposase InsO family protein
MRRYIENYVTRCDSCQRRKASSEFRAPLGEVEEPAEQFQVTSMDITGPYCLTPRKNKYLLTFIDHFTRYAEAIPIPDQTAETCARVYATQIIARHGSGSTLITNQGRAFISKFFKVCKILKIRKVQTSAYHPQSNGMVERFHKSLHDGMSHYINCNGTNWDVVVPFFLMAYRATPHSATKYSPYYLLHGREMILPGQEDLKAKTPEDLQNLEHSRRLESLKSSLRQAFDSVRLSSRKAHEKNKRNFDQKVKQRKFEVGDIVYLFCPAKKSGTGNKFRKFWQGPFQIVGRLSDLNYRIVDKKGKESVVHVNRLKMSYNPEAWNSPGRRRHEPRVEPRIADDQEHEVFIPSRPIVGGWDPEPQVAAEPLTPPNTRQSSVESPATEDRAANETSCSNERDPNYEPSNSPDTRRELEATPYGPPLTRLRARLQERREENEPPQS